jgi:hypothetical protein
VSPSNHERPPFDRLRRELSRTAQGERLALLNTSP